MPDPIDLFRRWYAAPLRLVEQLEHGDGAFIALACSCFLYERYTTAVLGAAGQRACDTAKLQQLAADFGIDADTADAFWNVVRNGFAHSGMGLQIQRQQALPRWSVSADNPRIELIRGAPGELRIQPWLVRDRVLELWEGRPELLDHIQSFPWASISPCPPADDIPPLKSLRSALLIRADSRDSR